MADDRPAGPDTIADELNRYFTGKYMAARDFRCDQHYFRNRQAAQARLLGGWGIVQGLTVEPSPDPDCAGWLVVRAGVAVAPSGRLLALAEDRTIEITTGGETVLALQGRDEGIEPAPLLVGNGTGDPDTREMNRIRECVDLVTLPPGRLPAGGWIGPPPGAQAALQGTPPALVALAPDLERQHLADEPAPDVVPLAFLHPADGDDARGGPRIATAGRRYFSATGGTRIVAHNWPHGGALTYDQLARWESRLIIVFSAPLLADPGPGRGVGDMTFRVSCIDAEGRQHHLPALNGPSDWVVADLGETVDPDLLREAGFPDGNLFAAVYRLNPHQVAQLEGRALEISLRCDFIPDATGRPIDGSYLGGQLPTGDGSPGGLFESWFTLSHGGAANDAARPEAAEKEEQNERS